MSWRLPRSQDLRRASSALERLIVERVRHLTRGKHTGFVLTYYRQLERSIAGVREDMLAILDGHGLSGLDASIKAIRGHLQWLREDFAAVVAARERGDLSDR